jgi:hypothetical protein
VCCSSLQVNLNNACTLTCAERESRAAVDHCNQGGLPACSHDAKQSCCRLSHMTCIVLVPAELLALT